MPDTSDDESRSDGALASAAKGAVRALWDDPALRAIWIVGLLVGAGFSFSRAPQFGPVIAGISVVVAWAQGFLTLLRFERDRRRP